MRIMVTGAFGFVGKHLLQTLRDNSCQVIAVDQAVDEQLFSMQGVKIIQCNLDECERLPLLIAERDIDCCVHLAWQGANGDQRGNAEVQWMNVRRTINLCKVLPQLGVKRFIGVGTLAEKDASYYVPVDGGMPNPVACYGVAKLAAHYMSKIVCTQLKIEHIWCQLSNLYGVGDFSTNFVNFASKRMLTGQRASFTTGEQMYDFVYITDIVKGIYKAAKDGKTNTTYYIGSGQPKRLKEFITMIRDTIDPSIPLYLGEVPFRGICLPDEEFDCSKLMNDTGYRAEVRFEEGIQKTVVWLKSQIIS